MNIFIKNGEVPLPKYIKRKATKDDVERYQTTYAQHQGSVAAPTAGLHFTENIIHKLKEKGVLIQYLTLHVTYNTFKPLSSDDYSEHEIGSEYCQIKDSLMKTIKKVKSSNKKIIAVGTTATRALENYATKGITGDYEGEADLYITPGYNFKIIDGLITNFHLPQSTLLLLVASLIGREKLLELYKQAIDNNYRFYSYGDSMLIKA
jgi:S-adenosylmethionine:tRNA ribosyltransferase-isomerase